MFRFLMGGHKRKIRLIIFSKVSCSKKTHGQGGCPEATRRTEWGRCLVESVHIEESVSVRRGRRRGEVVSAAAAADNRLKIVFRKSELQVPRPSPCKYLQCSDSDDQSLWWMRKQLMQSGRTGV